jgi:primosomal protein N' (replication factor Y)
MVARVTLEMALRKEFDYLVPSEWEDQVEVGTRVKVPFGPRQVMGCVTALLAESSHRKLRPVLKIVGTRALVTPAILKLARWISEYYCCPVETALKSVLPDAVRREDEGWRERLFVRALPPGGELPRLTRRQQEVWNIIEEWREMPLKELLARAETTAETVRKLEDKGLVTLAPQISERDPYAGEQILPTRPLALNPEQATALGRIIGAMDSGRTAKGQGRKTTGDAIPDHAPSTDRPGSGSPAVFLLHGVTGSGKTEVYLQAIARALQQGQGAIVLVPEISLTPQTVERFKARFCSGPLQTLVAVLHSHLSAGERHDEWHKIRQGRARIVIGARSAIFAPVDPLGLVIVDEEHEHSYKQEEAPRYHARDVAVLRARMEGAVVVLGSATPSLESYYNVKKGKYELLELLQRADDRKMPLVRVIDMRQEARKEKGTPIFSRKLKEEITQRLERSEQVMLFLNRRGYSTSLQCPKCGYVAQCPNCSLSLTYHRARQKICCHLCGHEAAVPARCPNDQCRNPAIRYAGLGTERVEETLARLFPRARVRRMDSDTLKRKDDYRRILGDFRTGKIDILVGTQMIAKGLHFPNVTLVGIIYADLSLHQPDFRAGERTFQLLTQVAGRAGRGDVEGEVVVQAFTPFHPAIQYARRHDFIGFYEQEIEFREQLRYPPITRAALLTLKGRNEEKVRFSADYLRRELDPLAGTESRTLSKPEDGGGIDGRSLREYGNAEMQELELDMPTKTSAPTVPPSHLPLRDLVIAGPAPAPLLRAETYYRYQIMLRTRQMSRLSRSLAQLVARLELPEDVSLTVDVDPVNLV